MSGSHSENPSYNVTLRVRIANLNGTLARTLAAIERAGGSIVSIDLVSASAEALTRDIVVHLSSEAQGKKVAAAIASVRGVELKNISDRVFLTHLGGKIEIVSKLPIRNRDDLSLAYTPGVARVSEAIRENPEKVWALTMKRNTVAIVTDGSSVLGRGNMGPLAALPVMEGKAQLFKSFGGINAFPICLDTQDAGEIIETVVRIAPPFGAINLEDIAAPRCFEVQKTLQALLDIPVFHNDQDGTAVVVLAGLMNALKIVGKKMKDVKVVVSGVGASGVGVTRLLLHAGIKSVIGCDRAGAVYEGRIENMNPVKEWFAQNTNRRKFRGSLAKALEGADVLIGLSAPGTVAPKDIRRMAKDPIVFALATPEPEVMPDKIPFARVIATGRADFPNQISTILAFPGVFRGCLSVRASEVTQEMLAAAAEALAGVVGKDELQPNYIIPAIFNRKIPRLVEDAVAEAAIRTGVARRQSPPELPGA